jgi:hypothetical protein
LQATTDLHRLKGTQMNRGNRLIRDALERVPALVLAAAATFLVFAAISAGFTPHGAELAAHTFGQPMLGL